MELQKKTSLHWRRALDKEEGREGWAWLIEKMPKVLKSESAHEMQFDAGRVQGYRECLDTLQELARMRDEETPSDPSND